MRHISTLLACLIFFLSSASAQDSNNFKIAGLKISNRPLPLANSNSENVIRFRCGATSLNVKPLLIIDGVMVEDSELKNISADNIDSITILKDHLATSLYGYRASWGVVL